ncbi:TPR Domain containing protein [Tritrichomonas foetus]|uniref:Intraflagellar transport protein 56 n=1 Tax=Tritrichomonas foetus TaxID=1144522 RepID=A0A1J4K5W2_9EUKA|nr:TPR Domain containing protein [Tritrichomonas foetus]|eukprot:OHT05070.1 TPR Domain containing protein [Tritrichomonas foetus]
MFFWRLKHIEEIPEECRFIIIRPYMFIKSYSLNFFYLPFLLGIMIKIVTRINGLQMIVGAKKKKHSTQPKETRAQEVPIPQPETNEQIILQSIENRDYTAAATFIEFIRDELKVPYTKELALWHGYSLFHQGEYLKAIDVYEKLLESEPDDLSLHLYISSCHYYNQSFDEAQASAEKGPTCDFKTRLLFHISHQRGDDQQLFKAHSELVGTLENQLSLAAIHFMRTHYQDAIDLYERLLQQHPDFLALYVYIAMCQYKLDQFQEANDSVDQYLAVNSDSAVGLNLKACAYLRLFEEPDIAESQLLQIRKFSSASYHFVEALIEHNLVVFHNGTDGFTVLPKIVESLPEARFNLALLYMRESNSPEAFNLLQDFTPLDINDMILKGTVLLAVGQLNGDTGILEEANNVFQEIGEMEVVRDTVPGRQCLATTKFITGDYAETLRVLKTIEDHMNESDEFNYNMAMTLGAQSRWPEAEKYFLLVKNPHYKNELFYTSWLCRCYIKNRKPESAWNLYTEATQTEDAKTLLQIISNDCFVGGFYYYSMKAYDVLSKFEGDATMRDGMIASAVGVFRSVLSRKESSDKLIDVLSALASEPEAEQTLQVIQDYIENSGEFEGVGW